MTQVTDPAIILLDCCDGRTVLVKRDDQIKRGQVIARSGQTGNVNAPQLHFEVRKGATTLDPMRLLKG
jgi:murein DD-endopeptidase MepM/ murein hydrolase activator NlpD